MLFQPARLFKIFLISLTLFSFLAIPSFVFAQRIGEGLPPDTTNWVESPEVTEVGKNAERARQLLYWVFSHPPVYGAQVLQKVWFISMGIAFAFTVFTIILFAIGFLVGQRRPGLVFSGISFSGTRNIAAIFIKIALVFLWITLSYIIVLMLIQFSEILMRFFIEKIGGKDLFNIFFAGQSVEKNYTDFRGFWDINRNNWEMRNTSIFFIRLTSFTYNVMSVILILRHIILMFLLMVSPFLALLMPFIFIRNTGWIWIGVFFQWIFYGPLFALFIAGITYIWQAGIPYPFDFTRRDNMVAGSAQTVYPTSINILWGGPAQTLSFNNSANYVDTYAEYVIALIMLWTATFLPWLLLRIFRDYCCEIMAQNQATLVQILDRIRGLGAPPSKPSVPGPTTTVARAIDLPFRKAVETSQKKLLTQITNVKQAETHEISQALQMKITSIQDVAEHEMSKTRQEQVKTNLEALRNPATVQEPELRERFTNLRNELMNRAARGDQLAKRLITTFQHRTSEIIRTTPTVERAVTTPEISKEVGVSENKVKEILQSVPLSRVVTSQTIRSTAQKTGVPESQVQKILSMRKPLIRRPIARPKTIVEISTEVGIPEGKVKEVLRTAPTTVPITSRTILTVSQKTGVPQPQVQKILASRKAVTISRRAPSAPPPVSVDDYEEVKSMWMTHYRDSEVPVSDKIKTRAQWVEEDIKKLTNVINLLSSVDEKLKQKGLEQVETILPFILLGGFSDVETIMYLKAKRAAAQHVKEEIEAIEKAKEKAKEEVEKEEELIEIRKPAVEEKAEKKLEAKKEQKRELPAVKKDKKSVEEKTGEEK